MIGLSSGSIAWGDYDKDGDLDIVLSGTIYHDNTVSRISQIYQNSIGRQNTSPFPPIDEFSSLYNNGTLTLNWGDGKDAETPVKGLYYNIRVGTTPKKDDIVSSKYGSPLFGSYYGLKAKKFILRGIKPGTYYWAVQTIDTSLSASDWSKEQVVTISDDFSWDFDDGNVNDWQATGLWHLETKRSHSSSYSFAYNNGTNYNTGGRNSGYIVSSDIDLTSASSAKLSFWTYWQHESYPYGSYDNMKIEVYDGAWHQIFYNDCNEGLSYSDWHKEEFGISNYCGKKIKLRFSFDTVDGSYNNYEGWYIDDVKIEFLPPPPLPIFEESFDDGDTNGWSLTGLWHITNKRSDTPQYSIAYNNGTNYDVGRTYGGAISPVIDLTKEDKAILSFKSWYETEYSSYWDTKEVYVATEDSNYSDWKRLLQITGTRRTWINHTIDLTPYCKKRIKIRFWFDSIDSLYNNYEGWYIDTIKIEREGKKAISIQSLPKILSLLNTRATSFLTPTDEPSDFEAIMTETLADIEKKEIKRKETCLSAHLHLSEVLRDGDKAEIEVQVEGPDEILGGEITFSFSGIKILSLEPISQIKGFYLIEQDRMKVQIVGPISEKRFFRIKAKIEGFPAKIGIKEVDLRDMLNHKIETTPDALMFEELITKLLSIYPNPVKDGCYIPFKLSEESDVVVEIYNILGQKVKTIATGYKKPGSYIKQDRAIFWDRRNDKKERVSSGLYFIKFKAKSFSATGALILR